MTEGHCKVELQLRRYIVKLGNINLCISLLSRSQKANLDQSVGLPLISIA